ncbi:anti-sigma-F factor Fin family protein [Mesobacillus maritimus]|jgi:hypothetical protein|uniref:Anti-sigma-F factor Fin family protein n=1 Tax=Mesobacillus maritimus TaxID=1643336 RepID=A0ABS7JZW4_9BACI|nr:anti-sigma-F factor Fin family protein [Mesobacillus maritimus]MBY0095475.1 anti-sigma-F factor Fin family protein [Mesobacillus maritimus]
MAMHYYCRHCGTNIGTLDRLSVQSESLGFHKLTDEERHDMISYESNGDIQIKSICEDCQESYERNPSYHENDYLIH